MTGTESPRNGVEVMSYRSGYKRGGFILSTIAIEKITISFYG